MALTLDLAKLVTIVKEDVLLNLGKMSAAISDRRMLKDQRRQPLIAKVKLLKASSDPEDRAKARRIEHNNLHNKKETKKRAAEREQLINYIRRDFKKKLFVKPKQPVKTLVIENLGPMGGQNILGRIHVSMFLQSALLALELVSLTICLFNMSTARTLSRGIRGVDFNEFNTI